MAFFYKYVDLSTYNKPQDISSESSDETSALISSDKQPPADGYTDDKGNESEFWFVLVLVEECSAIFSVSIFMLWIHCNTI